MVWAVEFAESEMERRLTSNLVLRMPFVGSELQMMVFCTVWSGRNRVLRPCSEGAAGASAPIADALCSPPSSLHGIMCNKLYAGLRRRRRAEAPQGPSPRQS
jgi:hypothetical protein